MRFTGKSSGGQLRTTVQNSRMAIGHLSLNDIRSGNSAGSVANANAGAAPLRALGVRDSADNSAAAVQASFETISNGSYLLSQNETYVTIKDPTNGAALVAAYQTAHPAATAAEAWAALTDAETGIKGDTHVAAVNGAQVGDVAALRNNILTSAGIFGPNSTGLQNPANGLLNQSFIPTKFMRKIKAGDGQTPGTNANFIGITGATAGDPLAGETIYTNVKNAYQSSFEVGAAAGVTTGTGAKYGTGTNAIAITAANYLFGDFNNDGKRDFQDIKYAQAGQALLASNNNYTSGGNTTTTYALGAQTTGKGDLIVKGDFNSDGKFDGKDLYILAHGAALADAGKTAVDLIDPDNGQLTTNAADPTMSDRYRGGTLYKNAALDYLQSGLGAATAAQKLAATADAANDPTGANAFNKLDVNRDGLVNRRDAQIVDTFVDTAAPKSIANLTDQLNAVVRTDTIAAGTAFVNAQGVALDPTAAANAAIPRKSISLVDVELNDNQTITHIVSGGGTSDMKIVADSLIAGGKLARGDTNFDGGVNGTDLFTVTSNFSNSNTTRKWSQGDTVNYDGKVDGSDLFAVTSAYNPNTTLPLVTPATRSLQPFAGTVGVADLVYDIISGNVTLKLDGANSISAFSLANDVGGAAFAFSNFQPPSASFFTTANGESITWQVSDFGAGFTTSSVSLGNIFPTGLTTAQLTAFLTQAQYNSGLGSGAINFDVNSVPEPTSLAIVGIGAATLLRRRRRA